jgi:hypothetical protein
VAWAAHSLYRLTVKLPHTISLSLLTYSENVRKPFHPKSVIVEAERTAVAISPRAGPLVWIVEPFLIGCDASETHQNPVSLAFGKTVAPAALPAGNGILLQFRECFVFGPRPAERDYGRS